MKRLLPQGILNGDGVDDIVVGAPKDSSVESTNGAIYIWYGYSGIFTDGDTDASQADAVVLGDGLVDWFGYDLAVQDVDGDGMAEIFVAAPFADAAYANAGAVYQIAGGNLFWRLFCIFTPPLGGVIGQHCEFGSEIELGDIDGDGAFDLLVSAPYQNGIFSQTGTVFGFLDVGSAVGETLSINPDWQIGWGQYRIQYGEHFRVGDLDSLGPDDVVDWQSKCRSYGGWRWYGVCFHDN